MDPFATERGEPDALVLQACQVMEQVRDEALFLLDLQGRVASWNQGVGSILGWDEGDWIGQPLQVAFTPEDIRAGVPQAELRQAVQYGQADDSRWMCRKSGERFFALGAITHMRDRQGRAVGFLKALRDLTGPRLAEARLQTLLRGESQARRWAETQAASLTAAIEAIADGVLIADLGGIHRCNAAALELLGVPSLAALQLPAQQLVQTLGLRTERAGPLLPADELPFGARLQERVKVRELWLTRAGGGEVLVRCAASPIVVDGRFEGTVTVLSDLVERQQLAEQGRALDRVQSELDERQAELRAMVAGVRDYAIFTLDTAGRIASWYLGAELMQGYTTAEAVGMHFGALFTPEDRAAGRPDQEMDIAARTGEYKGDGQRVRKDGSVVDAAVVLTALRDDSGQLLGYIKLTQDISERRRMEREREHVLRDAEAARSEAERASHSKGEFLATISHELRTPLSAILGWAHVLERGVCDTETVKHGLAAISRNAHVQVQLIEDLLDMNRIESGQLRLDVQRIELGGVIASAIDAALPAASAKNIGLRTVFGPDIGPVAGDAARLLQVVGNLLSNAIKFTPSGGQVSVTLSVWQGQAQIAVADTGQGIAPEFLSRMFDRFQQQDATTTRRHGGLGIGLAIVRHLVQMHGGTVQVHSLGPGHGSTFTVRLPAALPATAVPAPAGAQQPPPEPPPVRLDGISVLLVDDEFDGREIATRLLQDAGAHVLAASSAHEALTVLRQQQPDVILSDIGMPGTDGYELMRQVRSLTAGEGGRTPAGAFTAFTRDEDAVQAKAAGYHLHLAKPVAPAALVAAVAELSALSARSGNSGHSPR